MGYVAVGQGRDGGSFDILQPTFKIVQGVGGALGALRMSAPDVDKTMFRRSVAQFPKDLALGPPGKPPYGWQILYARAATVVQEYSNLAGMTWQTSNTGTGKRYEAKGCKLNGPTTACGYNIFLDKDGRGHNSGKEFPVIAYTVEENGLFSITDSKFTSYTAEGDGNQVMVFVDKIKKYADTTV